MLRPKLLTLIKNRPEEFSSRRVLKDLSAGLVVACIALPLSIALAIASGVTPEKGLITAIVAGFIISLFGGSRVQIGGPTGAFVVIVYGIIQPKLTIFWGWDLPAFPPAFLPNGVCISTVWGKSTGRPWRWGY